jgi:hypothetical protein
MPFSSGVPGAKTKPRWRGAGILFRPLAFPMSGSSRRFGNITRRGWLMNSNFQSQGKFRIPDALKIGHDDVRAELVRATSVPGRIGEAAERVAGLCLPHFAREEEFMFPVFGVLRELASGEVRPEMAEILPLVSTFSAWHDALDAQHQSIRSAIQALLLAAHREDNREVAEFAYCLRVHERLEDEVIYPMVPLIGRYVQEKLGI